MKLLFCGIASDDEKFQNILHATKTAPFAQQKLERMMLSGLSQLSTKENVEILSILPVQRFPRYPARVIHRQEDLLEQMKVRYIGFVNLPVLKQITTFFSMLRELLAWSGENKGEHKVVFLYGTNPLQAFPLVLMRLLTGCKIVSFVSEIDSFRLLDDKNIILRIKNKLFVTVSALFAHSFDAYVLISEHMLEQINKRKKPHLVIEGMVDGGGAFVPRERKKELLYAGSLHKRYGIGKLVEAFELLNQSEYKLVIYGSGDYVPELQEKMKHNPLIEYRGTAENSVILAAEREATLLINPRPSAELFTKYSFPSKTFEYMLSGTPCVITKLMGIPDTYFQYCYSFEDESATGMANRLKEVLAISSAERETLAKSAYEYVIQKKHKRTQMKQIWDFFEEVL